MFETDDRTCSTSFFFLQKKNVTFFKNFYVTFFTKEKNQSWIKCDGLLNLFLLYDSKHILTFM